MKIPNLLSANSCRDLRFSAVGVYCAFVTDGARSSNAAAAICMDLLMKFISYVFYLSFYAKVYYEGEKDK
jgi:hypothetical protein